MQERSRRDHVDDRGRRALLEVRDGLLDEEHRPAQVHVHRLRVGLGCEVTEVLAQRRRRVVHDDVEAAELADRPLHQVVQRVQLAQMRRDSDRRTAHRAERPCGLFTRVGLAAGDCDVSPGGDEALSDRTADATGAAGDDRHAPGQVEQGSQLVLVHARTVAQPAPPVAIPVIRTGVARRPRSSASTSPDHGRRLGGRRASQCRRRRLRPAARRRCSASAGGFGTGRTGNAAWRCHG